VIVIWIHTVVTVETYM